MVTESSKASFLDRYDFLLRRLHSLTGIVPIGVFLVLHLLTNSSIVWGALDKRNIERAGPGGHPGVAAFHHDVHFINDTLPFLIFIEVTLWASLAFHALYGLYIAKTGRSNVNRYDYRDNWRYVLQRVTGYVGILFILYHVATLRWGWTFLVPGGTRWSAEFAASTMASALRGSAQGLTTAGILVSLGYLLGVSMLVFHFANGLWTAAISWGLTVSSAAQKRWGYVCTALGAGLMLMAWSAVAAFATLDVERAEATERNMRQAPVVERADRRPEN